MLEWKTEVPILWTEVVLQGPHIGLANPFAKQPNEQCQNRNDYSSWNLESLPVRVLPRTNYQRVCDRPTYEASLDQWDGSLSTGHWRVGWRRMVASGEERCLKASVIQPGPAHVDTVSTCKLPTTGETVQLAGLLASVVYDYLVKVSGKADVRVELLNRFPAPLNTPHAQAILLRTLRLNCLTADYAPLWRELFDPAFTVDSWAEPGITGLLLGDIGPTWTMATPLRTDYDRRKALVELDALAALALDLSAEQLCAMYRSQFAVTRKYEFNMAFSANGRKIAKDHQTAGFHQEKGDWDLAKAWFDNPGTTNLPSRYAAPLWRPNRESEMTTAWHAFRASTGL